jgi:hypothetical protein
MVMMNYSSECMATMHEWINKQNTILEKQIIKAKAKEMQEEIDREVLWSMLKGLGWHRVMLPVWYHNKQAVDVAVWAEENCELAYEHSGRDFIFESAKDATFFKLKFL